jgi:hypothetical protein
MEALAPVTWVPPSAEDRRTQRSTTWDELGYLHNHAIRPDGTLGRYHSNCSGCDLREDENP